MFVLVFWIQLVQIVYVHCAIVVVGALFVGWGGRWCIRDAVVVAVDVGGIVC